MWLLLSSLAALAQAAPPAEPPGASPTAEPAPPEAPALPAEPVAEPVSAARLCADAALGTEVEVCVRLATTYTDQADGVIAALRGHMDRAAQTDRAFLGALLLLLDEQTGADGAARLGALADVRAVPPLVHAGHTREVPVAVAAAHALARYPEGVTPLVGWLDDNSLAIELRIAAAQALGESGDLRGGDALVTALRRRGNPATLRAAMMGVIEQDFPQLASALDKQVTHDGAHWLALGSAWGLGHGLAMTGRFGRAHLDGLGGVSGVIAGGTGGWVIGRTWPMEADESAFLASNIIVGSVGGSLIGGALVQDDPRNGGGNDRVDAAMVTGFGAEVAGLGLSLATRRTYGGDEMDTLEASAVGGATSLFAYSVAERATVNNGPVDVPQLAAGLGLVAGHAVGHIVAPRIDIDPRRRALIGLGTYYGLEAGLLWPPSVNNRGELGLLGSTGGALVAYGLSSKVHPTLQAVTIAGAGEAYGSAFGLGFGMLADPADRHNGTVWRAATLAGDTIGLGLGALGGSRVEEEIDVPDVIATGVVTGWAAWNAVGWYRVAPPPVSADGWYVLLPSAAGIAVMATTPYTEVPLSYSFSAASLGFWGGYLGGVTAELRRGEVLRSSLVGSDVGFLAGLAVAAPPIGGSTLVIGVADAGGVLGGSTFALGASFLTTDPDAILGASMVGSAAGFGSGVAIGRALQRTGRTRESALRRPHLKGLPGTWMVSPAVLPGEYGPRYGAQIVGVGW